jgi:hypothetical protein
MTAMLSVALDKLNCVVVFETEGPLSESDFCSAAARVNAMVDEFGHLNGIVIRARTFPGWESVVSIVSHLQYTKGLHKTLTRVALVTASMAAHLAEVFSTHFVNAEIKIFPYDDIAKANQWVTAKSKDSLPH